MDNNTFDNKLKQMLESGENNLPEISNNEEILQNIQKQLKRRKIKTIVLFTSVAACIVLVLFLLNKPEPVDTITKEPSIVVEHKKQEEKKEEKSKEKTEVIEQSETQSQEAKEQNIIGTKTAKITNKQQTSVKVASTIPEEKIIEAKEPALVEATNPQNNELIAYIEPDSLSIPEKTEFELAQNQTYSTNNNVTYIIIIPEKQQEKQQQKSTPPFSLLASRNSNLSDETQQNEMQFALLSSKNKSQKMEKQKDREKQPKSILGFGLNNENSNSDNEPYRINIRLK